VAYKLTMVDNGPGPDTVLEGKDPSTVIEAWGKLPWWGGFTSEGLRRQILFVNDLDFEQPRSDEDILRAVVDAHPESFRLEETGATTRGLISRALDALPGNRLS